MLPQYLRTGITDMEKAKRNKKIYLIVALLSAFFAIVLTALAIVSVFNLKYGLGITLAVLSAIGYFAAVFLFFAFLDVKIIIKIISLAENGKSPPVSEAAILLGWKETPTKAFIAKAIKKGYLS